MNKQEIERLVEERVDVAADHYLLKKSGTTHFLTYGGRNFSGSSNAELVDRILKGDDNEHYMDDHITGLEHGPAGRNLGHKRFALDSKKFKPISVGWRHQALREQKDAQDIIELMSSARHRLKEIKEDGYESRLKIDGGVPNDRVPSLRAIKDYLETSVELVNLMIIEAPNL
ncbi:hypothetical protein LCGC14_2339490 [marine sediment metagenome]|uniref:Uncharacterized protein n=1 Tax=marine sediment metagenome TaxID=412755 RepID=A0A0F9CD90_9ZZZZ